MRCFTCAHKQSAGVTLPEGVEESIDTVEQHSEALGQIGSAAAKLDITGIIAVMNAYPDVSRIQVLPARRLR
jgi:hypothetical protein